MKIVIIIGVLLVLFLIFKPNMSYLTPPMPRKTDQEVEVESVADIAISSGACGIRPTIA